MSDVEKMYKAPEKLGDIQTPTEGSAGVTPDTRLFIGQSASWLKFIGVMGFIGCGFMALFGVLALFIPGTLSSMPGMSGNMLSGMGAMVGVLYLGFAVLMFFPARFTFRMGAAANSYKFQGQSRDLQEVASNLKKWAKFNGIMAIVLIGIFVLVIIGSIIFGLAAASNYL